MQALDIFGVVVIFLAILFIIMGCFYLITKQSTVVFLAPIETSPLTGFIEKVSQNINKQKPDKTIAFAGDIMLDRGVEYQIKQNNNDYSYPFEKIKDFLKGFDIVFGNLEGPIVENPPDFSDTSLRFAFDELSAGAISLAGFNVVSLANNHTDNMLWKGLFQTRAFLTQNNVDYVGEPWGCTQDFILEKQGILFLAFNKTYPQNCQNEQITQIVKNQRIRNPEQFLVVVMHWGAEYQLTASTEQQKLAHQMIDQGADLIIGSHPHVAQNIELYKNRLIFHSLGNFLFDQYFLKSTQEGLIVGVEVFQEKLVFRLHPVSAGRAQPFLMQSAAKKQFLQELAERSSAVLEGKIRAGRISINRAINR